MRKLILFISAFLFASTSFAAVTVTENNDATVYSVSVDRLKFYKVNLQGKAFSGVTLEGVRGYGGVLYKEGNPQIPVVRLVVDSDRANVVVSSMQKTRLPESEVQLRPVLPSAVKIRGSDQRFVFNQKVYRNNKAYPSSAYTLTPMGTVRGQKKSLLTLYPVSYNPVTGDIAFRNAFEVRVPKAHAKSTESQLPPGIAFVVGAKFAASPALDRYLEFKKGQGFAVEKIVVGTDANDAASIRQRLRSLYASSAMRLSYAILVGDAEDVPGFTSTHISGMTDHFYASLDTEAYETDIFTPDIAVGRFSVASEDQLAAVVEKNMVYQRGVFASERWLNGAAFLATDDRYQVAEGSHNYAIEQYTKAAGYEGIFPLANNPGGDQLYAITHRVPNETVQAALMAGRTIVDYSGHGAHELWDAPRVTQNDVRALNNDSALPFVISNACITGDYSIPESFSETWQRHRYGAITFWGSIDSTYWDEDDILERAMFDGIYARGKSTFGEITHYALEEVAKHYGNQGRSAYYWESYNVLGDPSVNLRTTYTRMARILGPAEIPVGLSGLEYSVQDEQGQPLVNTPVAMLATDGRFLASARTDQSGVVRFEAPAGFAPGTKIRFSVQGANLRESSLEVTFISPNSPYLTLRDVRVNGRNSMIASPNEELAIGMKVANVGMVGTQGASMVIAAVEGPAIVLQGSTGLSALEPGTNAEVDPTLFRVRVSPQATARDSIRLHLQWTTVEGISGNSTITIRVLRGMVESLSTDFGGPIVDGSGIRPGNAGMVYVTLKNTGTETMQDLVLEASAGMCATVAGGRLEISSLAPGQSQRIATPVDVTVDGSCHSGDRVGLFLNGQYRGAGGATVVSGEASFVAGVIAQTEVAADQIGLAIPDAADPVDYAMEVPAQGVITEVGVQLMIKHSYVGDLVIDLVHPDGTAARLYNNEGGGAADLTLAIGLGGNSTTPELAKFVGKPMNGTWKIRVQDTAGSDVGTLETAKILLKGFTD